jgi:rod shape determining protein RodA
VNARILRLRDFDPLLLLAAIGLVALGAALIYSGNLRQFGSPEPSDLSHPVVRQGMYAAVGIGLALVIARVDYQWLGIFSVAMYILAIASLVYVLFAGDTTYGSRRWIDIGGTQVQPSEIAKLVTVVALAKFISGREASIVTFRMLLMSLSIAALPAALVLMQPDLGSAVIFGAIWLGIVVVAGARWHHLFFIAAVFAVALPLFFAGFGEDYQQERIEIWLEPEKDPLGPAMQSLQGEISIGSGGLAGKGLTDGTQTQLHYLQAPTTDYIFSVLGEELGFVGAVILFALFLVVVWRGLHAAEVSRDVFGRLLATGIVVYILLQTFINVAVNVGLLPVTGIPLPFVSQGGSSLITLFIAIGILESISLRHRKATFHELASRGY